MAFRKRFLDDLWFAWFGNKSEFSKFKTALNKIGKKHGITFKGEVGTSIDFLDVSVTLNETHFSTKMYIKPTDASRYLHRRSDHARHTFKSIPFTQFRRAVLLCSEAEQRIGCMNYIAEKLKNSGYKMKEIDDAKMRALNLNRQDLIQPRRRKDKTENVNQKQLTFSVYRNDDMSKKIRATLQENQRDIDKLLGGPTRLIVAEKKNNSTASLLFSKSSFSRCETVEGENQKCGGHGGCKTCEVMTLPRTVTLWKMIRKEK